MSIGRRLWAGLRLAVLAGVCGVVLAVSVAGGGLAAYRWGEARATSARSAPPAPPSGGMSESDDQPTNQTHGGVQG